jgi:tripartite-type tricarboxylate transporter receptor subunit TctC
MDVRRVFMIASTRTKEIVRVYRGKIKLNITKEGGRYMSCKKNPVILSVISLLMVTSFATNGFSQGIYPDRPITLIVPSGAGGITDLSARALAKATEKALGQSIIVENKPGAGMIVGKSFVLKSKPDGYTLGVTGTSTYILTPNIRQVPYDPFTDITEIMSFTNLSFGLAVKADASWETYGDVITYVKKNPGKFTYSTSGAGLAQHIGMERIAIKEGMKWTHIPFKSGPEAATATLGGHTHGVAQTITDIFPHLKEGKLKLLLVLSERRLPDFPNVPTILEKGYGFHIFSTFNIFGPKGLPEPIRQKLETIFQNATKDPSFIETMKGIRLEPYYMSGSEYEAKWKSQFHEMGRVLKDLGLVEK